jgi:predicted membrane chloride channel (bestrophin family)
MLQSSSPWLVPLIVTGVSWILFATEEIGHVIEDPFGRREGGREGE